LRRLHIANYPGNFYPNSYPIIPPLEGLRRLVVQGEGGAVRYIGDVPRRKPPSASEIFRAHRLLLQAGAAYDREVTGREPTIGDVLVPLDGAGHPLPNPVIIHTNIEEVCRWLRTLFLPLPLHRGHELEFSRWFLAIEAGKRLADILREEGIPTAKHAAMRKQFERWRRA
jgi:hypothetical protein